jgi:hypothetical protein
MSDEKKKKIESALDKMEAESLQRAQENRKFRVIEKHQIKKEVEENIKIKTHQVVEQKDLRAYEFRSKTTVFVLSSIGCLIFVWNLSQDQRTTLIEYGIYITLVAGIIAAKSKR